MNKILVGVVSANEFERAQARISELSSFVGYEDWLDSRYGRFMSLSLGGAEAILETVSLDDFLRWCRARKMRPSEASLDTYAQHSASSSRREPLSAA
jgi:hypothetical protein